MEHGNGLHGEVVKSLPLEIFKSHLLSDRTRSWATCCRCLWLSRNVGPSSSGPLKSQLFCDSVIFFYGTLSTSPALSHFLLGGLKESLMLPCMASIIVYWLLEHLKFNAKINTTVIYCCVTIIYVVCIAPPTYMKGVACISWDKLVYIFLCTEAILVVIVFSKFQCVICLFTTSTMH